jgi:hypothetical protein
MAALRPITLRLPELFNLFDESIARIPSEHKGPTLAAFCSTLKSEHGVAQTEIDECVRMLIFKEDYKKGFVGPGGVVRRKEIVATRSVGVSHPEEMGGNGLLWRDARR